MTKSELSKAAAVIATNYGQSLTNEQLNLWYSIIGEIPVEKFAHALKQHIIDPDQGRFTPLPAHIMRFLIKSDHQIKLEAGQAFDKNPSIDGLPHHEANRENAFQRQQRRKEYQQAQFNEWQQDTSYEDKLWYSGVITIDQARKIRHEQHNDTARLTHGSV